jgi:hypothetical protein
MIYAEFFLTHNFIEQIYHIIKIKIYKELNYSFLTLYC